MLGRISVPVSLRVSFILQDVRWAFTGTREQKITLDEVAAEKTSAWLCFAAQAGSELEIKFYCLPNWSSAIYCYKLMKGPVGGTVR